MLTSPYFSRRLPRDLTPSPTAMQLQQAQATCNLMQSNPTVCAFDYPDVALPGAGAGTWAYAPHPLGADSARRAVANYIAANYGSVGVAQVMLTASTSEAYGLLFKLLTDPGDGIVVGTPTYPLVQHLAELEHLQVNTFGSHFEGRWHADMLQAEAHLQAGARLIVLICPNNPTGATMRLDEAKAWADLACRYRVPLVVDQVFAPYADADWPAITAALSKAPLACFLDGLSKAAALPHVKLGWIAVRGQAAHVCATMEKLAWLGDAYLSVSSPVQQGAQALLDVAQAVQPQVQRRVASNRRWLADAVAAVPEISLLASDGGWYGVLRLPQTICEDEVVIRLAKDAQVQLHPGYFYDFPQRGYLVTGLLLEPQHFASGWRRALRVLGEIYR